ncbi:MAG: hypothetical protein MZV64_15540 [Ignavibacteriales bacterium]|nr:hypothetical protein [Ignavibacteriales bacterium]
MPGDRRGRLMRHVRHASSQIQRSTSALRSPDSLSRAAAHCHFPARARRWDCLPRGSAYTPSVPRRVWLCGFRNRVLDGLDGLLARMHDKQSDFGGYVDILTDFVVYAALPIGLVAGSPSNERYLALAFMLASFYVNTASWMYLAAILEKRSARDPDTQTTIVMPAGHHRRI